MPTIITTLRNSRNKLAKWLTPLWKFLRFFSGWIIPGLLVLLILLPVILMFLRSNQRDQVFPEAVEVQRGQLVKSIKTSGNVEPIYSYDVKIYQNAKITELLVKKGDFVEKDQVLAKIDFINNTKLRETDILSQINTTNQESRNLAGSSSDAQKIAGATLNQLNLQVENRENELNNLDQKITNKNLENSNKRDRLIKERDTLQAQFNTLESTKYIYDSLKTLGDELTSKRDQLQSFDVASNTQKLKTQIQQQQAAIDNSNTIKNSDVCNSSTPFYNKTSCDQANNNYNLANTTKNDLETQLTQIKPVDSGAKTRLEFDIKELENKIKALQATPEYNGAITRTPPYSDQNYNAVIENQKAELKKEIESRKNDIKIIDDTKEVDTLKDQQTTLERTKAELEASRNTQSASLNQTINSLNQQKASNSTQNANLAQKLADIQTDIKDQEDTKTLKAKKSGVIGDILVDQDLEIQAGQVEFKVFSPDYRVKFKVSADSRSKLEKNLPVNLINETFKTVKGAKISFASLTPVPSINQTDTPEYEVFVDLPRTQNVNFVSGQSADLEIILQKLDDVLYVPRNAVDENRVYLASGASKVGLTKTYAKFESRDVKTGLDAGANIEILSGLEAGELVFPVYPRTPEDKAKLETQFKQNQ